MMINVVFMGSPEFALPTLRKIHDHYCVVGVVTQPDRPAGRGKILTPPPVKLLAQELGIPTIQPNRLREPEALAQLEAWKPDLIVVAAFGQILRQNVLDLPRYGCVNVHASLLPRWRGVAPIQAALLNGDSITGVTIMQMDAGVDTGPILTQAQMAISPDDTAGSLSNRLAEIGADLLIETLPGYLDGTILPRPQDETLATYAGAIKKEHGLLDFTQSAEVLVRKVRAYNPWPSAFIWWRGEMLKIHRAHAVAADNTVPGRTGQVGYLPAIGARDSWLVLDEVQLSGRKAMAGDVFLRGTRDWLLYQAGI